MTDAKSESLGLPAWKLDDEVLKVVLSGHLITPAQRKLLEAIHAHWHAQGKEKAEKQCTYSMPWTRSEKFYAADMPWQTGISTALAVFVLLLKHQKISAHLALIFQDGVRLGRYLRALTTCASAEVCNERKVKESSRTTNYTHFGDLTVYACTVLHVPKGLEPTFLIGKYLGREAFQSMVERHLAPYVGFIPTMMIEAHFVTEQKEKETTSLHASGPMSRDAILREILETTPQLYERENVETVVAKTTLPGSSFCPDCPQDRPCSLCGEKFCNKCASHLCD